MSSESEQGGVPVFDAGFFEAPSSPCPARGVKPAAAISAASDDELMMRRVEAQAKSYALKLDVVKQIEDFEIARREHYDHKRSSNSMYWMAFTLIMRRAKGENTRYLDFFVRKVAAEQTYVCCLLEMKEESEKVKDTYGKQQHGAATAFGTAPRKDLLDDLLGVEEAVAGKVHALARAVETQVIPKIEGTITKFNAAVEEILREGETHLADIEWAESGVQRAFVKYRDQAQALEKLGSLDTDLWLHEMRYRVAVGVLQETWAVCSKALGALFARMKDTETARRQAIHAALQTLHEQQTGYWRAMPELGHTLSALLQTRVADPHVIEKEIGTDIRAGAQRLGHSEEGRRTKANITASRPQRVFTPPQPVATAAVTRAPKEFAHALAGPLQSPLTKRAQVLYRKTTNVFKPWKPVLAVLTADDYLHLFDLPSSKASITAGDTPTEEVFSALVTHPLSLNKASGLTTHSPSKTLTFSPLGKDTRPVLLSPDLSFHLVQCEAHSKSGKESVDFEVAERGGEQRGIQKVFKDLAHKKVALRASSKAEAEEWCALIDRITCAAAPHGAT